MTQAEKWQVQGEMQGHSGDEAPRSKECPPRQNDRMGSAEKEPIETEEIELRKSQ